MPYIKSLCLVTVRALICVIVCAITCALTLTTATAETEHQRQYRANTQEVSKSAGKIVARQKDQHTIDAHLSARLHTTPVWIHSTWLDYITDLDGDGFHHHFRFGFDADTTYTSQPIYAQLLLVDGVDEAPLFESDRFWLQGDSGNDAYEISTSLNAGYPAQTYDLVLRLYDADTHALVAQLTYLEDNNLANLFLEDADSDTLFYSAAYIYHYSTELLQDTDSDGHFTHLNMTIDLDAPHATSAVQLGVEILHPENGWLSVYLSPEWLITGTHQADAQNINITLENGFPEDHYEVRLTVYDSNSRAIVTHETISLRHPLESQDYDQDYGSHLASSTSVGGTVSGGAMNIWLLPFLLLLYTLRE